MTEGEEPPHNALRHNFCSVRRPTSETLAGATIMNLITKFLGAAAIAVSFAAAAEPASAYYESTFFPMKTGNTWTYSQSGFAPSGSPINVKIDATYVSPTTGYLYFRFRGLNGDLHWLRQNSAGRIYEWGNYQWYRLGAGPGFPWTMDIDASAGHGAVACADGATLEVVSR